MNKDTLIAKRGYIYEFETKTPYNSKVFALVVSSDARSADNIVNVILLSDTYMPECIEIRNNMFPTESLYCNCGKVTHTERNRLVKEICKISDKKMEKIDITLSRCLGLNPELLATENKVYKELYNGLLEKVIGERRYEETHTDKN